MALSQEVVSKTMMEPRELNKEEVEALKEQQGKEVKVIGRKVMKQIRLPRFVLLTLRDPPRAKAREREKVARQVKEVEARPRHQPAPLPPRSPQEPLLESWRSKGHFLENAGGAERQAIGKVAARPRLLESPKL